MDDPLTTSNDEGDLDHLNNHLNVYTLQFWQCHYVIRVDEELGMV